MPKCVKCLEYFHPDMCIETNIRGDDVIVCVFCKLHKKELTIEDKDGNFLKKVTKKQAPEEYKQYLNRLIKKPNISKLLSKE
jgi:hypothetical protein